MAPSVDDHHGVQQCEGVLAVSAGSERKRGCVGPTPLIFVDVTAFSFSFVKKSKKSLPM